MYGRIFQLCEAEEVCGITEPHLFPCSRTDNVPGKGATDKRCEEMFSPCSQAEMPCRWAGLCEWACVQAPVAILHIYQAAQALGTLFFLAPKMMAVDAINSWDQKIGADRASVTKRSCGIFTFF